MPPAPQKKLMENSCTDDYAEGGGGDAMRGKKKSGVDTKPATRDSCGRGRCVSNEQKGEFATRRRGKAKRLKRRGFVEMKPGQNQLTLKEKI